MVDLPNMGGIKFHDGAQKATMMKLPLNVAPTKRVAMARGVLLVSDSCNDERLKVLHAAVIRAVVATATRHLEKERANVLQLRATANDAKLSDAARASAQAKLEYTPGRCAALDTIINHPSEFYAATMAPAHMWKVMEALDATIQLYPRDDTDLALKKDRSDVAKAFQRQGGICTVDVATGGSIKKEEARMAMSLVPALLAAPLGNDVQCLRGSGVASNSTLVAPSAKAERDITKQLVICSCST